jgi:molecular chaperone GrpE (heat shock protein)
MTTDPENEQTPPEKLRAREDQVTMLQEDLETAKREAIQNREAAQRAQAELVNFRRRSDEERITLGKYSNNRLIIKLLPVMEELGLAVADAEDGGPNASWLDGVKLIQRKLMILLESEGVAAIETVGAMFNPVEHQALGTVETTQYPPGYVTEAVRPGYRLHDRVLQPAQVMVARQPQGGSQQGEAPKTKETDYD